MTIGPGGPGGPGGPSVADLLAAGPVGLTEEKKRPLIGVPEGYVITRPGEEIPVEGIGYRTGSPTLFQPVFRDGDEYIPAQSSAEDRARLQMLMYDLGILDTDFQVGVWDTPTRQAYRSVLEFANGAGLADVREALRQYGNLLDAQTGQINGPRGPKREPLVIRQTNPDDIRRVAEGVAAQVLGERADESVIERIVAAYHSQEAGAQTRAYDLAGASGGTVITPPDAGGLATLAEREIRAADPAAAGAHDVAGGVVGDFLDIIGGPFGGDL